MTATYVFNQELLKYNERVLKERKPETQSTIIHQKRRLAEQREQLARLKVRRIATRSCHSPPGSCCVKLKQPPNNTFDTCSSNYAIQSSHVWTDSGIWPYMSCSMDIAQRFTYLPVLMSEEAPDIAKIGKGDRSRLVQQKLTAAERSHTDEHSKLTAENRRRTEGIQHQLSKQETYHSKNDRTFNEVCWLGASNLMLALRLHTFLKSGCRFGSFLLACSRGPCQQYAHQQ